MIVLPVLARLFMDSTIDMAINESRPEVGSSQKSKPGLVIISLANASLRLSPPLIPFMLRDGTPIIVFSHFFKFN